MKKNEIIKEVNRLSDNGEWNCYFELPYNIKTRSYHINSPGYNLNKWPRLKNILDSINIENKSIVDVGCGDGFYIIECLKEGAKYCLGIDLDPLRINRCNFVKKVYDLKNIDFKNLSLYDLEENKFDIVMGLGLLHRVPDLDACIKKLSNLGDKVLVEFKSLDSTNNEKLFAGGKSKSNSLNGLWYVPTKSYVISKFFNLGFKNHTIFEDKTSKLNFKRTIILFERN